MAERAQAPPKQRSRQALPRRIWETVRALGPGLVAGASDCDPTTVATMSVAGSTTGFGLSALTILVFPMLASVQIISAQVGVVAKAGLQKVVTDLYGKPWSLILLLSVLAVNLVTIGADLEAGAASLALMIHIDLRWFVVPYAALLLGIVVFGSYEAVVRILKYVLLIFLAYVLSAFLAHPDWGSVLRATVLPHLSFDGQYVQAALAILGTSLTSYAYVWETQEEAEEEKPIGRLIHARMDAGVGMAAAVALFWFILITTGTTLGVHHHQVQTAQEAATALRPVAGPAAEYLFAVGLLASSFIAVPVLAATSAYLVTQEMDWQRGLSKSVAHAKRFYAVAVGAMLVAIAISLAGVPPIKLLFIASITGGLGTPIGLIFLLLAARSHKAMDGHAIGGLLTAVGWITTVLVSVVSLYFLWQQFGAPLLHR
jgi:Mn2+/Fe2+ NRAMP family transporter